MPGPKNPELRELIDEMIASTRKGTLAWKAVNPTTFVWEKPPTLPGAGAKITLQRVAYIETEKVHGDIVPRFVEKANFILQVHELAPFGGQVLKLTASGSDDPELNKRLDELFRLIGSGVSEVGLEFLKNLIPRG